VQTANLVARRLHVKDDHNGTWCTENCSYYAATPLDMDTHNHKCHFIQGRYATCPVACRATFGNKHTRRLYWARRLTFTEKRGFSGHMRGKHAWTVPEVDAEILRQTALGDKWDAFVLPPGGVKCDPSVTDCQMARERKAKQDRQNRSK